MQLNDVNYGRALPVEGYGDGFFRIGGVAQAAPLLLSGDQVTPWGGLGAAEPLVALAGQVDVLLIGMGAEIAHLPAALQSALDAAGLGAEVMASPQACRTYNVLLGEGRRVALALLPV